MKTWQVVYSARAYEDLDYIYNSILEYYESKRAAENIINKIRNSIKDLSFMADGYHRYQEEPYFSNGVRYYSEGKNCIFYEYNENTVTVLRIINGRRDISAALKI